METKMSTVAIVGRANVGKSTLFNRIVGFRKALVLDQPGTTRDRNYARATWEGREFFLVDTGGFEPTSNEEMLLQMRRQANIAIEEADVIIFLMSCRDSLLPADKEIAKMLRAVAKPVLFVVNKVDGPKQEDLAADFYALGVDSLHTISSLQGYGVPDLLDVLVEVLPLGAGAERGKEKKIAQEGKGGENGESGGGDAEDMAEDTEEIRLAFVGKPNAGKSSLINKILGYERLIVNQQPGTTRDVIDTHIVVNGQKYLLIDTAGIRRKNRLSLVLEKYSVLQAIGAVKRCDIAVLVIDAALDITEQDVKIAGIIAEAGKGCIIAVNKWDTLEKDEKTVGVYVRKIREKLKFMDYAPLVFISALTGQRLDRIFQAALLIKGEYTKRVNTALLNEIGKSFLAQKAPPRYRGINNSFYYMTQASIKPPTFVFFVKEPSKVHFSYERYLINCLRETFGFENSPIRVIFRKRD